VKGVTGRFHGADARADAQPRVLYIVYWGAAEPLGQALVLPSVTRLAGLGARLTLVTFDKPEDLERREDIAAIRLDLEGQGIRWISLRYHKQPQAPAKMYDMVAGWMRSIAAQLGERTTIVHARTFMGGLMGLVLARVLRMRLIYHNEGFYPDEQVDGDVWVAGSARHRIARRLEAHLYARADGIVALSHRARAVIEALPSVRRKRTPVLAVPSAVDLHRFTRSDAGGSGRRKGLHLIYTGSVGARYRLDQAARFAAAAAAEFGGVNLRVLTRADRRLVDEMLAAGDLARAACSVAEVPHAAMPAELGRHDAGLFFLTQGLSEHGCSPTKIGEYWACGLPVVSTPNVSDTDEIVQRERVGVIVKERSEAGYREAARALRVLLEDADLGRRCRRAAERHYALEPACEDQMALYRQLLA
jgi:glycosyltransferase involved in cell wall biosynthesis